MLDLGAIEARVVDCSTYNFGMRNADRLAREDAPALVGRVRELEAERDALAAVIEEVRRNYAGRNYAEDSSDLPVVLDGIAVALSRTPSDVLVERDARIRAEVIDWFAHETFPYVVNKARARFGLTKGADRG